MNNEWKLLWYSIKSFLGGGGGGGLSNTVKSIMLAFFMAEILIWDLLNLKQECYLVSHDIMIRFLFFRIEISLSATSVNLLG
jgi:hypothetical protein